jgi:hypothetical protein
MRPGRGSRFPIFGLRAEEGYVYDLAKSEKVNLATGEIIPVKPEVIKAQKAELGL